MIERVLKKFIFQATGFSHMRAHRLVAIVLTGFLSTNGVHAAGQAKVKSVVNAQCIKLTAAIDDAVKDMSATTADGVTDDSAPRATMRAAQIGGKQSEIQNYILLMRANGCAPYTGSLSPSTYIIPAMECFTARLTEQTARLEKQYNSVRKPTISTQDSGGRVRKTPVPPTPPPPAVVAASDNVAVATLSSVACDRSKWVPK